MRLYMSIKWSSKREKGLKGEGETICVQRAQKETYWWVDKGEEEEYAMDGKSLIHDGFTWMDFLQIQNNKGQKEWGEKDVLRLKKENFSRAQVKCILHDCGK